MEELIKKEKKLMVEPATQLLTDLLLDEFKNRKGQDVIEVENFQFVEIDIDQENSEFKDKIVVNRVSARAKVWVDLNGEGKTNNYLDIFTNKGFELNYDTVKKEYQLGNVSEVVLIDKTM